MIIDQKLVIIIGLPGSGKSTFSKKLDEYVIFDDFINKFYNGEVLNTISDGSKVCLIDPRLCIYSVFLKYISRLEKQVNRSDILLILFENNPVDCLNNVKERSNSVQFGTNIKNYSEEYNLDKYVEWNSIVLPVHNYF